MEGEIRFCNENCVPVSRDEQLKEEDIENLGGRIKLPQVVSDEIEFSNLFDEENHPSASLTARDLLVSPNVATDGVHPPLLLNDQEDHQLEIDHIETEDCYESQQCLPENLHKTQNSLQTAGPHDFSAVHDSPNPFSSLVLSNEYGNTELSSDEINCYKHCRGSKPLELIKEAEKQTCEINNLFTDESNISSSKDEPLVIKNDRLEFNAIQDNSPHSDQNILATVSDNLISQNDNPIRHEPNFQLTTLPNEVTRPMELNGCDDLNSTSYELPRNTRGIKDVTITGSENVAVGTNINAGRLTINQFINGSIIPNQDQLNKDVIGTKKKVSCFPKLKYFWGVFLLVSIITAAIIIPLVYFRHQQTSQPQISEVVTDSIASLGANYSQRLVPWSEWTQHPQAVLKPFSVHPARYVVVCHTAGVFCDSPLVCSNVVRGIESLHVKKGLSTAWYNFMIGGDGFIYEARGWDNEGDHSPGFNCASIGIAFLGNFNSEKLSPTMEEAYKVLIEEGLKRGALSQDYKMVGHFQVKNTGSPGLNIMKVFKTWPHWGSPKKEDFICV